MPLVLSSVPRSAAAGALQLVWAPGSAVDPASADRAAARSWPGSTQLDLDEPEHHVDGLEARSLALALGKWLLTRDRVPRPDLRGADSRGRAWPLLARGQPDWPWAVRFLPRRPGAARAAARPARRATGPPLSLLRRTRVMVLGLGTGSLFCAEAPAFFDEMIFVDCKEVRPVNPVRQIYPTSRIGQPKTEAMTELLARRLDPDAALGARLARPGRGAARRLAGAGARRAAAEREPRPDPCQAFARLLDELRPDLVVVAMGRSRDDNFVATEELRRRGVRHLTPSAFPGRDPLQAHPHRRRAAAPATTACRATWPWTAARARRWPPTSVRCSTAARSRPPSPRLTPRRTACCAWPSTWRCPRGARPAYLLRELAAERACFVGANRAEQHGAAGWLYGIDRPFAMVTYGAEDMVATGLRQTCSCGRPLGARAFAAMRLATVMAATTQP